MLGDHEGHAYNENMLISGIFIMRVVCSIDSGLIDPCGCLPQSHFLTWLRNLTPAATGPTPAPGEPGQLLQANATNGVENVHSGSGETHNGSQWSSPRYMAGPIIRHFVDILKSLFHAANLGNEVVYKLTVRDAVHLLTCYALGNTIGMQPSEKIKALAVATSAQ